jgi:uncharacterized membrane protein YkoI
MTTDDRRRFPLWVPIAAAAAGAVVAFGAVAVLDLDRDEYVTVIPASQPAAPLASTEVQPAAEQAASTGSAATPTDAPTEPQASDAVIDRDQAGAIAAAHVGGIVDSIDTENDYGAAWDVDVYAADGEYTIYVSATGQIVRVVGPYGWD